MTEPQQPWADMLRELCRKYDAIEGEWPEHRWEGWAFYKYVIGEHVDKYIGKGEAPDDWPEPRHE